MREIAGIWNKIANHGGNYFETEVNFTQGTQVREMAATQWVEYALLHACEIITV